LKEEAEEEGEWHTKYQKLAVETRKLTVQLEKKKLWELPMKIVVEKIEGETSISCVSPHLKPRTLLTQPMTKYFFCGENLCITL